MQPLALEPFDQVYLLRRVRYADGRANQGASREVQAATQSSEPVKVAGNRP